MAPISRRMFLTGSVAIVLAACSDDAADSDDDANAGDTGATTPPATEVPAATAAIELPGDPFTLGVASGDPDTTSVILWTRLALEPVAGGGMTDDPVEVVWELATDETFEVLLASGTATAVAEHAHSLHVTAAPEPATTGPMFYRFRVGDHISPIGRTMLAPAGAVPAATFVSASCQNYQAGFYAAHRDISAQQPDFVMWLGDYIYEGGGATVGEGGAVRSHDSPEPMDLASYRNRYGLYKSDVNLQAAHHACPWFVIWDDHEVENNYAGDVPQEQADAASFAARRQAAYTAWWEHQPVRLAPPAETGEFRIYRDARWGDLIGICLLDTRQYRSDQTCGDLTLSLEPACPETFDDGRSLTGSEQEQWLFETVGSHAATWNVIAQQVVMSNLTLNGAVLNYDQWDGYPKNRDRVLQHLADAEIPNVVVLSGDLHLAGVGILRAGEPGSGQPVGVEFVDTSISSTGIVDPAVSALVRSFPDIVDVELTYRGYILHTVTPSGWTATYRIVESVHDESSPVKTYRSFAVEAGTVAVRVIE